MLTEERHSIITEIINRRGSAKIGELCELLDSSESTIRRDLNVLAEQGVINKVHGGAISVNENFSKYEYDVSKKTGLFIEEKDAIAKYAASLIEDGDFVYIDAGTTTEKMFDHITSGKVTFVTNAFVNAGKLAKRGFKVFVPGGEIKPITEAIVGAECVMALQKYNFTKCFMGVNGISLTGGISTHDESEAAVKSMAIRQSREVYFLADNSKFDSITSVRFAELKSGTIITDRLADKKYLHEASIKEVLG